jgi:hypothetical protein
MHWRPEHVNPMLALRLALLNGRWSESWQEQQRLRQRQQQLKRQTRQQQRLLEQQAKRQEAHPPPSPVPPTPKPTRQKTGRTEGQYRWGRQTFSPRLLKQADGAKNETHPSGTANTSSTDSSFAWSSVFTVLCVLSVNSRMWASNTTENFACCVRARR